MTSCPPCAHRVARVERQVHHHLLHLAVVGFHAAEARAEAGHERDVLAEQRAEHPLHALHHGVQAQHLAGDDPLPPEAEELAGEVHRPLGRLPDLVGVRPPDVLPLQRGQQEVAEAHDDHHHVVEIVGHAAGEPPDGLHLLRLPDLLLGLDPLGDVAADADDTRHRSARPAERREGRLHVPQAPAGGAGPLVGHGLAGERAQVGALVDRGALVAHDLGGGPAQEVRGLEPLALEPAAEDVDAALIPIQPEHHVVDRFDQRPEALLRALDRRQRRGALGQEELVRGEGRRALQRRREEAGDQADGVHVEVVERVRPPRPDGHHRLDSVLALERDEDAGARPEGLDRGAIGARIHGEIVAADQLARAIALAHQAGIDRDDHPDPVPAGPAGLAQHQPVVLRHEHARRPGAGERLQPLGDHAHDRAEVGIGGGHRLLRLDDGREPLGLPGEHVAGLPPAGHVAHAGHDAVRRRRDPHGEPALERAEEAFELDLRLLHQRPKRFRLEPRADEPRNHVPDGAADRRPRAHGPAAGGILRPAHSRG